MRQNALDWLKADPGEGECRILSNARCLSEGIDVPALDAVVFFDTRESIVDIVQSVGRVMRKAEGKQYGYIILPVCIPSDKVKDYNSYIDSDPQFKGIWKVIKALRAHDESLVDEAEFRRKIKVIGGGNGGRRGRRREAGERRHAAARFPMLPLDAVNDEAVYAAIPKKLGDREYWSEWAKGIAGDRRAPDRAHQARCSRRTPAWQGIRHLPEGAAGHAEPSSHRADEAIEMLAQHILTLPVFRGAFRRASVHPTTTPWPRRCRRSSPSSTRGAVDSETEGLEKFYENVRERISLAKSDKSKQDIIRNLYDTFFNNAFPRMAERLGIVYTPVEVVDFILRSAEIALRPLRGKHRPATGVQILDPFAGTGTFPWCA